MKNIFTLFFLTLFASGALAQTQQFRANLYILDPKGPVLMDGTLSMYDASFSNEVNSQDARKMFNPGENLGMLRDGRTLIVERREAITRPDSVFFKIWNTRIIAYRLELSARNFEHTGIRAVLYDRYLDKEIHFNLTENYQHDFSVTADADSRRTDRFMVVFFPGIGESVMPLHFISTSVSPGNNGIAITWQTAHEQNVKHFVVERSVDGVNFESTNMIVQARNSDDNHYKTTDKQPVNGYNYYRINALDVDGKSSLSRVMKVTSVNVHAKAVVYPNPATASNIQVSLTGYLPGQYRISVISGFGRVLHSQTEQLNGESARIKITNQQALPNGIYRLEITGPGGYKTTQTLMIQH